MDFVPTPKQTLLLWDVLGRGGATPQSAVPFTVKAADRAALVQAGLLSTRKIGASLWLSAEDKGWAWANDHLDASLAEAPKPRKQTAKAPTKPAAPAKVPTLQNWLTHLSALLEKTNQSLSDVIPYAALPELPEKKPKARKEKAAPSKRGRKTEAAGDIEADIRKAVAALEGSPQREGVRLSALRKQLAHLGKADVDAALVDLFGAGKIILMNLANPQDIAAERETAISYKGQTYQVLWLPK